MTNPLIHVVANQKGGVGKTTLTMNLAATSDEVLTPRGRHRMIDAEEVAASQVMVVSTDSQGSVQEWAERAEKRGGLPFDWDQVDDARDLQKLRGLPKKHIFIDTPGSLDDEDMLLAALEVCDDVLVPMEPEAMCFTPTRRTIEEVILPRGIPFTVVVNNWDPRDGDLDLRDTATFIRKRGWPMCNTVIRGYKVHTRASAEGRVVTQYLKNRVAMEGREDFLHLALELGYGGTARAATGA